MISLKFIPLTFITSNDEIIRQIKNTVVFSHLFETCEETFFSNYIETTQYGFTASALENGSHRMLRITDIHHSKVNWESVPFCDCPDDEKYLLRDNDILVARTGGTTGKSFFVENPPSNAVFASYLIRIRLKKDVNIEFINAFLNSYCFWSQIVEMKAGSAQPNVNAEKLKVLVIPDCDLETQAKAVRLIKEENTSDSIREKINSVESLFWNNNKISTELNHQLALVEELRQAYLREAMQGKLARQDVADEAAEILLEKIKAEKEKLVHEKRIRRDKPLPPINAEEIPFEIPSNWTWCRFDDLISNQRTDVRTGPFGSALQKQEHKSVGIPVWGIESISKDGKFTRKNKIFVTEEKAQGLKSFYAKSGDLIISRSGTIAELCMLPEGISKGLISTNLMKISVNKKVIYPEYFCYLIKGGSFVKDMLAEFCSGSTRLFLTQTILNKLIFPLPPLAEQERIVAKLEKLMKFCDELEVSIKQGITNADQLLQVTLKEALEPKEPSEATCR